MEPETRILSTRKNPTRKDFSKPDPTRTRILAGPIQL